MLEKGATPIVGQNEGEDHEVYQDFYKHKTKITRQEYEKLKGIINDEDLHRLEMELESNFTVQCGEWLTKRSNPLEPGFAILGSHNLN